MAIRFFLITSVCVVLFACSGSKQLSKQYTFEDKQVFDLVERLKKNPADAEAKRLLPAAYTKAVETRKQLAEATNNNLEGGDKHMALARQYEVMRAMYEAIVSTPAAYEAIPDPWNPAKEILDARSAAAQDYYDEGLVYLNLNTRPYAQKAYDYFAKANEAVPGYKDVRDMMALAKDKSIIKVVVNPVNYYNNPFGFWGFQNDWMQDQLVRDLNFRSYRDVKFFTEWQARSQNIVPDKVVDLVYTRIYISQLYTNSYSYNRSAEIKVGETKSNPPKPIYEKVTATVYVTSRYFQSNAALQCRIYDVLSNRNIMFETFPNTYNWKEESATYKGDSRALTAEDWARINNNNFNTPDRYAIADRLLRDSYNMLISRINSSVQF